MSKQSNQIKQYFMCPECLAEWPRRKHEEYAQIDAGWTKNGLQVWCRRHKVSIVEIDLKNLKVNTHP